MDSQNMFDSYVAPFPIISARFLSALRKTIGRLHKCVFPERIEQNFVDICRRACLYTGLVQHFFDLKETRSLIYGCWEISPDSTRF